MSKISSTFIVTAIDDGLTLHGSLSANKTLTQAWTGNTFTPDWSVAENQPTITLTLYSGATNVTPDEEYEWQLDGTKIVFGEDGISNDGLFKKFEEGGTPKLKIIGNLQTEANSVDTHTITFVGKYNTGGSASLDFSASILTRISVMNQGGYIGVLEFKGGNANITNEISEVQIYAKLYGSGENTAVATSDYTVSWYVNEELKSGSTSETEGYYLKVTNSQVTDNAVVRAEFKGKQNNELLYTAFTSVDDLTDPERMYIQYNGSDGQSATLRKGEEVTFAIWVGKMDDPTPIFANWLYEIKLLDANGEVVEEDIEGLPSATGGWRTLSKKGFEQKAYITITYPIVTELGRSITGIIRATEQELDFGGGGLTPQ